MNEGWCAPHLIREYELHLRHTNISAHVTRPAPNASQGEIRKALVSNHGMAEQRPAWVVGYEEGWDVGIDAI